MPIGRRPLLAAGLGLAAGPALAQGTLHLHQAGQFERLNQPGRMDLPALHHAHAVTDSPAPRAARQGSWRALAHAAPPAGSLRRDGLHRARGADPHHRGGAIGSENRRSIDWHLVYDPRTDRYGRRQPMPLGRDHAGIAVVEGAIHLIGGRVDSFHTNSNLHHSYDPLSDSWTFRAPIPTARSGHGCVWYRDRIFCMGGEGTNRVYGRNEAYDPLMDRWEPYAPMLTPRHGMGAVALGDSILFAGGGPQMGGGVKSAINEVFTLA